MATTQQNYVTFTEATFQQDVLDSPKPVLVDFWAPWCGPCHVLAPVIDELAVEFEGQVHVGKVNVDDHPSLAVKYGIQSIPAVLIFKDGKVVDQSVGAVPKQVLTEKLRAVI